jgi:RNA polymerase sigma factor (sigma-70 family)
MAANTLTPLVRHLHAVATPLAERTDEELLHAFASSEEDTSSSRREAAFAAIVRRHGCLVLGVCRRALNHEQDAEDAFQATFLILARNAGSIRKRTSLAAWLHGVACRVARKARARRASARRGAGGAACFEAGQRRPSPQEELTWAEVRSILDEEVARLPAVYREAFVLCCLRGASRAEAAAQLGVKEGTLSSRLAGGRKRLEAALTRRGVTLDSLAAPLVPPALAARTTGLVTGSAGSIQGAVARLAAATKSPPAWPKLAGCLAALVVLSVAAAALSPQSKGERAAAAAPAREEPQAVEVRGRVVDPQGRPAPGASVSLVSRGAPDQKPSLVATAGADGRFAFRLRTRDQHPDARLAATAKGFAPGWEGLTAGRELTLRLVPDDVPLHGRLVSLEGKPLEGVTVELLWVGRDPGGKVEDWISTFVGTMNRGGGWIYELGLDVIRPQALGVPRSVTTDKDGRFRVEGIGRDRVVTLVVRSERTAVVTFQVPLCAGRKEPWVEGNRGLYHTGFIFSLAPGKAIVGTVRDKKTGKPIAGVPVYHDDWRASATTNEKGEYRILGAPKQPAHGVFTEGRKGVPYLSQHKRNLADTPGLEPVRVNFELEHGIELTGRLLDKVTGKPVRGLVTYSYTNDNPHLKEFTEPSFSGEWGRVAPDGSFTVLGMPGPGALTAHARPSTGYARIDAEDQLRKLNVRGYPTEAAHAVVAIDVPAGAASPRPYTILVTPAASRLGTLVDAEGKPVTGAAVVGDGDGKRPRTLTSNEVTMPGLRPSRSRALVALHEGRQLGAVAAVGGDPSRPFEVRLLPLGALTGRLVDADGTPLPNRTVRLYLWLDPKKFENLPWEMRASTGFGIVAGAWSDFTSREATTDERGQFHVKGLIAAEQYSLVAGEGHLSRPEQVSHFVPRYRVEPGKGTDVGDVKPPKGRR